MESAQLEAHKSFTPSQSSDRVSCAARRGVRLQHRAELGTLCSSDDLESSSEIQVQPVSGEPSLFYIAELKQCIMCSMNISPGDAHVSVCVCV